MSPWQQYTMEAEARFSIADIWPRGAGSTTSWSGRNHSRFVFSSVSYCLSEDSTWVRRRLVSRSRSFDLTSLRGTFVSCIIRNQTWTRMKTGIVRKHPPRSLRDTHRRKWPDLFGSNESAASSCWKFNKIRRCGSSSYLPDCFHTL